MNSFGDPDEDFEENALANIYLEHRFDNDVKLSVEGGLIRGTVTQNVRLEDVKVDATTSFMKMNLDNGPFTLQAFWNRGDERSDPFFPPGDDVDILYNTFDLEAQHAVDMGLNNTFIYGANYRFNTIESNIIDKEHQQNLIAGYFQDEYRPIPEVSLLAGARVDHHPLVGVNFSPRGTVIYAPAPNNTFRVSISRAFRNPSFTDSYIEISIPPPPGLPIGVLAVGEPDLQSEKITTYELGYLYFPRHYFRCEIDVFAYRFGDYIAPGPVKFPSGLPVQSYVNLGSATAYGFELTADLIPAPWLKFSANYSYQDLDNEYTVYQQQLPSKNKANFKSFLSLSSGFSASFSTSFVGKTIWEIATAQGDYHVTETSSHTRCDARLAYNPRNKNLELFCAVLNLFDSQHLEYPLGEKVRRRATAGMNFSF